MAKGSTGIDTLELVIDFDLKQPDMAKTINSIAESIERLNSAVSSVGNLKNYMSAIRRVTRQRVYSGGQNAQAAVATSVSKTSDTTQDVDNAVANATKSQEELNNAIQTHITLSDKDANATERIKVAIKKLEQSFKGSGKSAKESAKVFELAAEQLEATEKEQEKLSTITKKTTTVWGSFIKSIGRIALYRLIRSVLKTISQAMQEGIQNYAQYSEEANRALSSIKNSASQLKNTLGITLGYMLEVLEPAIVSLTNSAIELFNNINMALASMANKDQYDKAKKLNYDYVESLKKVNSQLFSFDKFNTISGGQNGTDPKDMFFPEDVPERLNDSAQAFKDIFEIVRQVAGIIKSIIDGIKDSGVGDTMLKQIRKNLDLVQKIVSRIGPPLGKIIKSVTEFTLTLTEKFQPFIDRIIDRLGILLDIIAPMIESALLQVSAILKLLTGDVKGAFEDLKLSFKSLGDVFNAVVDPIVNKFKTLWNIIEKVVSALSKLQGANNGKKLINTGSPTLTMGNGLRLFAGGGVVPQGTAFIAGEAGAEAVFNMSNGRTGVANIEQMQQAFAGALDQKTNVYLQGIYQMMGQGSSSGGANLTQFVNAIMPEIDNYNRRRGVMV